MWVCVCVRLETLCHVDLVGPASDRTGALKRTRSPRPCHLGRMGPHPRIFPGVTPPWLPRPAPSRCPAPLAEDEWAVPYDAAAQCVVRLTVRGPCPRERLLVLPRAAAAPGYTWVPELCAALAQRPTEGPDGDVCRFAPALGVPFGPHCGIPTVSEDTEKSGSPLSPRPPCGGPGHRGGQGRCRGGARPPSMVRCQEGVSVSPWGDADPHTCQGGSGPTARGIQEPQKVKFFFRCFAPFFWHFWQSFIARKVPKRRKTSHPDRTTEMGVEGHPTPWTVGGGRPTSPLPVHQTLPPSLAAGAGGGRAGGWQPSGCGPFVCCDVDGLAWHEESW